jgi:hypothetical protein
MLPVTCARLWESDACWEWGRNEIHALGQIGGHGVSRSMGARMLPSCWPPQTLRRRPQTGEGWELVWSGVGVTNKCQPT